MREVRNRATGEPIASGDRTPRESSAMLTVQDVAEILNCSGRTVYRLADSGRMPRPIKLGALVRWPREQVEAWIANGCAHCRSTSSRRAADGRKAVRG